MQLILFVCRGNTCRSPMAEVAARDAMRKLGSAARATFASAGVAVDPVGGPADPRAVRCVGAEGLDLGRHRSRQADDALLKSAARIYALDRGVREQLKVMAPDATRRVALLTSLIPEAGVDDVADPFSGTDADYEAAYRIIRRAVAALAMELAAGPQLGLLRP